MTLRRAACILWLVAAGVVCATRMEVRGGLGFFMPQGEGARQDAQLLGALSDSALANQLLVSITAPDEAAAVAAYHGMVEALAGEPIVTPELTTRYGRLLFDHREAFLSEAPEADLPALLSPDGVTRRIEALKAELSGGLGALRRGSATADPLGFFQRQLARMGAVGDRAHVREVDGALLSRARGPAGQAHALLIIASGEGGVAGAGAGALLARVRDAFARVDQAADGGLRLRLSGIAPYAVAAEGQTRADVQRISGWSTAAIVALFIGILGSLRYLLLGLLPLVSAFVAATAACLMWHGSIHAMTFAFGAALIGVCIDYPIHLFNRASGAADGVAPDVARALVLGAVTTIVGLSALGWAGLPGIRQVALFGGVGVATALAVTLWLLPPLLPSAALPARHARLARRVASGLFRARPGPWRSLAPVAVLVAVLACAAIGLPQVRFVDDPQALTAVDAQIAAEDQAVRRLLVGSDASGPGDLVISVGEGDLATALARNDQVAAQLQRAQAAGLLSGFDGLHTLLWSPQLQARNLAQLQAHLQPVQVRQALVGAGFVAEAFAPFFDRAGDPASLSPLRLADVPVELRRPLLEPWVLSLHGSAAVATRLVGVRDRARLRADLARLDGVRLVSPADLRKRAYADFRTRTLQLAAVGLCGVFLVMGLRYRRLGAVAAAFVPAALAAAGAAGLLALCGVGLNLMHVVGFLLVLSVGADYGVFLVEHRVDEHTVAAAAAARATGQTGVALIMACLSTVLSFGLLAMSAVPALASVGQAVALGVVLAFLLAVAFHRLLVAERS